MKDRTRVLYSRHASATADQARLRKVRKMKYPPGWKIEYDGVEWRVIDEQGGVKMRAMTYHRADSYAHSCFRTPRVGRMT